ncbi:putative glucan 1,3-beta-glucosidase [Helianthus annuus]|nr:putative glucan 1,3-beta-glucosidase [Helianthus annuus]
MEGDTIIDTKGLFSIHMPAYYDSIIKGVSTIMTSYSSWNELKCTKTVSLSPTTSRTRSNSE